MWVLDSSAPLHYPGVELDPEWRLRMYRGSDLPAGLRDYTARPHSWERYVQDVLNNVRPGTRPGHTVAPLRDQQRVQERRIRAAHAQGAPGYLLQWPTGSGKTAVCIHAADALREVESVLAIVKLATIPAWRASIDRFSAGRQRWVVLNSERLSMLFADPEEHTSPGTGVDRSRRAALHGKPQVRWDLVIVDESQILAQPTSLRARIVRRLESECPFMVFATATGFSTPRETAYVARLLAYAAGIDPPVEVEDSYEDWLRELGLKLFRDESGRWQHTHNGDDVDRLTRLLYDKGVGDAASPEELGLPAQSRELRPIALSDKDKRAYDQAWIAFRHEQGLPTAQSIEATLPMTDKLRHVQKASLLKVPAIAEMIAGLVADGRQVVVSMYFLESIATLHQATQAALRHRGLPARVVSITGQDSAAFGQPADEDRRERKRQAFQVGAASVVITNSYEGINLHAGESDIDGRGRAGNDVPRVTLMADVLTGGKKLLQAEGRPQRDGQTAPAFYVFAADTAEQDWLAAACRATANTRALSRYQRDAQNLLALAAELDRDQETGAADDPTTAEDTADRDVLV